jgi:hypothetical protein
VTLRIWDIAEPSNELGWVHLQPSSKAEKALEAEIALSPFDF